MIYITIKMLTSTCQEVLICNNPAQIAIFDT